MNKFEKMWKEYHLKKLRQANKKQLIKGFFISFYEGLILLIFIVIMFVFLYLI